jgi:polygalacturonase
MMGPVLVDFDRLLVTTGDFGGESGRLMHQSLLFTWSTTNVSVGGGGVIDCNGDFFQGCGSDLAKAPCSGHARPECVFFSNATDVVFEDVTVLNSPDWTLHFSSVDRLRVRRVNVTQPGGGNRDGIDIDSCQDVVVEDSYFASGDDTLCVKSGLDFFGRRYNRPSRDIIFRNITTGQGYGITIGSEVSGGVENVTFENITVHHQTAGIHIKAPPGRGAYIRDIVYRNIHLINVRQCILIGIDGGKDLNATALTNVSNILFENVRCDVGTTSSYDMAGQNNSFPIQNMRFVNVTMGNNGTVGVPMKQANCQAVDCTCDALTSPCPTCCTKVE